VTGNAVDTGRDSPKSHHKSTLFADSRLFASGTQFILKIDDILKIAARLLNVRNGLLMDRDRDGG